MIKSFLEKLLHTVRRFSMIADGDSILVALSGGADSAALLYSLCFLRKKFALKIYAVHVHHGIRGHEADMDAEFAEKLSKSFDVPFKLCFADIPSVAKKQKISIELAGRQERYEILRKCAKELGCGKIAIGHHEDDQAETVMMRIIRGTGSKGFKGIEPVREGLFIRPLLNISKKEILNLLEKENIPHREDSSNTDSTYFRNKIRNEIFPLLQTCNSRIKKNLTAMGEILSSESDFIDAEAREVYKKIALKKNDFVSIDLSSLRNLHIALRRRIFRMAAADLTSSLTDIDFALTEALNDLVLSPSDGTAVFRNCIALKNRTALILKPKSEIDNIALNEELVEEKYPLSDNFYSNRAEMLFRIDAAKKDRKIIRDNPMCAMLDADRLAFPLYVRFRRRGDLFRGIGMNGKKKLKKFFCDEKVSLADRDMIPLVTDVNDEIVWVVGYRIGDRFKITDITENIFIISAQKRRRDSDAVHAIQ